MPLIFMQIFIIPQISLIGKTHFSRLFSVIWNHIFIEPMQASIGLHIDLEPGNLLLRIEVLSE